MFTLEERQDEVVNVEVENRNATPGKMLAATYRLESSEGRLQPGESATIA